MSNSQAIPNNVTSTAVNVDGGQMNLLMNEFEKQREMFMKLCENQNALLAGSLDGLSAVASLTVTATAPVQVAQAYAPVAAAPAMVPAPVVAPAIEAAPVVQEPIVQEVVQPAAVTPEPVIQESITPEPVVAEPVAAEAPVPAASNGRPENLFDFVASLMARAVEMHVDDIDPDQNIMELGADSMTAMSMVKEMETTYDIELPATLLFEYSTLNELVDYLRTEVED